MIFMDERIAEPKNMMLIMRIIFVVKLKKKRVGKVVN